MKKLFAVILVLGLTLSMAVITPQTEAATRKDFKKFVYSNPDKYGSDELPYRLFVPENYDETKEYPLVIFLHGAGERGNDNEIQLNFTTSATRLIATSYLENFPCIILVPQCPQKYQWVAADWGKGSYDQDAIEITPPLKMLMDVVESLESEYSIDKARLYATGFSMGGFGTWDLITRYPGRFAAAVAICGGGDPTKAASIKDTPVWAFHGDKDSVVPVSGTREMVDAIKSAGGGVIEYTEYKGQEHNIWETAFSRKTLYEWMFAQKLEQVPEDSPEPTETPEVSDTPRTGQGGMEEEDDKQDSNNIVIYIIIIAAAVIIAGAIVFIGLKKKK